MDITADIKKLDNTGSDQRMVKWRTIALIAFVVVALVSGVLAYRYASDREDTYLQGLNRRMDSSVRERVGVLSAWLNSQEDKGVRLVNSDLFRLYAADLDSYDGDISSFIMRDQDAPPTRNEQNLDINDEEAVYLREQLPLLERTLRSFVQLNGFESGRVINTSGQIFISTNSAVISLSDTQHEYIKLCIDSGKVQFAPIRIDRDKGPIWDMFMPIYAPQQSGPAVKVVAVLLMSVSAGKALGETLASSAMMDENDKIRLVQREKGDFYYVDVVTATISKIDHPIVLNEDNNLPFDKRASLGENAQAYSIGIKLPQGDWWLVQEGDVGASSTVIRGFWALAFGLALLVTLVVGLGGFAMWWGQMSKRNRKLAQDFYELASQEQMQRSLLDSINASVLDFICLKTADGEYTYVNAAMAKAFNRDPLKMVGLKDQDLFGYNTAKRLEVADLKVLQSGQAVNSKETIYIENQAYEFQISKVPYYSEDGKVDGIVSVYRDITEMVRAQERQGKAMDGIVEAMVTAVEMIDPYLGGHSERVKILSEAVAQSLNMSEDSIATVKLSANLSQLGKMFVDRRLLDKQGVFTEEERAAMREEVQYSARILRKIDFSLPIYTTVYQMNERPDGSGYPQGLTGDEITPEATILCVVNTFCAMMRPRSYREGLSPEKALDIMRSNPGQNDPRVVDALAQLIYSPLGDRCLATLKS